MTRANVKQGLALAALLVAVLLAGSCIQSWGISTSIRSCTPECIRSAPLSEATFARGKERGEFPRGCSGGCERETSCADRALAQIEEPWTLRGMLGLLHNASQGKKVFELDGPDAAICLERVNQCYNECKNLALESAEQNNN